MMQRSGGPVMATGQFGGTAQFSNPAPRTGIPPPTAGGAALGSIGAPRPGSALKRLNTAGGAPPNVNAPVGLATNLTVAARPVTTQGMRGMSTQPLGPGRQLADKSYYLGELRKKIEDLTHEIASLKEEHNKFQRDNTIYSQLERRYETVVKEVRGLEGQLADFNLALDKIRTNTDVKEIDEIYQRLRSRNDQERRAVDDIFLRAQSFQAASKQIEAKVGEVHRKAAERMSTLGEEAQQEYRDLEEESNQLQAQLQSKQNLLRDIDNRIVRANADLKSPEFQMHTRGLSAQKKKRALQKEKQELEEEVSAHMSPAELKDKLTGRVRDANAEIANADKRIKRLEEQVEKLQDDVREKDNEVMEAKKHAQKAKKYEALYERDRQMQDFIDKYPEARNEEVRRKQRLQETILLLLKHISKGLDTKQHVQSQEKLADMKAELTFKETNLANAKETFAIAQKELEKRKEELDKINSLDKKIAVEGDYLRGRIKAMTSEMGAFKTEEQLQEESNNAKKQLAKEKVSTKKARDAMKLHVQQLSRAMEKKKMELQANEAVKRFENYEQRLRTYMQTEFQLADYINTRKRESDYEGVAKEVMSLTSEINAVSISQAGKPPTLLGA